MFITAGLVGLLLFVLASYAITAWGETSKLRRMHRAGYLRCDDEACRHCHPAKRRPR